MENLLNRCNGLSPADRQLITTSIQSLEELIGLSTDPEIFKQVTKVDPKILPSLQSLILSTYSAPISSLSTLHSNQKTSLLIFSTGCSPLDRLLSGGCFVGEITEFVGPSSSGKTQICMSIAAYTTAYTEGKVLYIDTNASFSSKRVKEMYGMWNMEKPALKNLQSALSDIIVYSIQDIFALTSTLNNIFTQLQEQTSLLSHSLRVIIIDSVATLLSPLLGAASTPADKYPSRGHALMVSLTHLLYRLAIEFQIAVVVTNYTVGAVKDGRRGENEEEREGLGESWSYVAGVRIRTKLMNTTKNLDDNPIVGMIDINDKENNIDLAQGGGGKQAESMGIQCSITKSNKAVRTSAVLLSIPLDKYSLELTN